MNLDNEPLNPWMLGYREPEPKKEDFQVNVVRNGYNDTITIAFDGKMAFNETAYQSALTEHRRKTVRPVPFPTTENWNEITALLRLENGNELEKRKAEQWFEYQSDLHYFEKHQTLFDGWEIRKSDNGLEAIKGNSRIYFYLGKTANPGAITFVLHDEEDKPLVQATFWNGITVRTTREMLEQNGIEI